MKIADVLMNGFTENLGTDYIAVNAAGTPIGRAASEEAVRGANPNAAAYFTGADFERHEKNPKTAPEKTVATEPVNEEPVNEEPVNEEPVNEEPVNEEPVNEEPVNEEPVNEEPPTEVPDKPAPKKRTAKKS